MLLDYPDEWRKYYVPGKKRTFGKDTPANIVDAVKKLNARLVEITGSPHFYFEDEETND